jgi:hypothetical protein
MCLTDELRTWGWREGYFDQEGCEWVTGKAIGREVIETALEALGLSATSAAHSGDNMCYVIEHFEEEAEDKDGDLIPIGNQHYIANGQQYFVGS